MSEPWQPESETMEREPWQQAGDVRPADLRTQDGIATLMAWLRDLGMLKPGEMPRQVHAHGCPASKPPYATCTCPGGPEIMYPDWDELNPCATISRSRGFMSDTRVQQPTTAIPVGTEPPASAEVMPHSEHHDWLMVWPGDPLDVNEPVTDNPPATDLWIATADELVGDVWGPIGA